MARVTRVAIDGLVRKLGLPPPDPGSQDWQLEIANPERLTEWTEQYRSVALTEDERHTFMITLLESLEQADREVIEEVWLKIAGFLAAAPAVHQTTIAYWCAWDDDDPQNHFRITARMRVFSDGLRLPRTSSEPGAT